MLFWRATFCSAWSTTASSTLHADFARQLQLRLLGDQAIQHLARELRARRQRRALLRELLLDSGTMRERTSLLVIGSELTTATM